MFKSQHCGSTYDNHKSDGYGHEDKKHCDDWNDQHHWDSDKYSHCWEPKTHCYDDDKSYDSGHERNDHCDNGNYDHSSSSFHHS